MAQQPAECHAHPGLKDAWVAKNWGLSLVILLGATYWRWLGYV
jgi:hypothetical protein